MPSVINFKIVTPQGVLYEDEINKLTVPTASGEITVLANHMPIVSLLRPGEMTIHKGGRQFHFAVARGVIEVQPESEVVVLANSADRAEDIDLEEAEAARRRAEEILEKKERLNDVEFSRFTSVLERELARLKVGSKYSRK